MKLETVCMEMAIKFVKITVYCSNNILEINVTWFTNTRLDWAGGRRLKVFLCGEHCEAQWAVENGGERGESCQVLNH